MKLRYPIEDGIPLLLLPALRRAANAASSDQHDPAVRPATDPSPATDQSVGTA